MDLYAPQPTTSFEPPAHPPLSPFESFPFFRSAAALARFAGVADRIAASLAPEGVFDNGCRAGLLIETLHDRGVRVEGREETTALRDLARPDIRALCQEGNAADPIPAGFELIVCLDVLQHLSEAKALAAIERMCAAAPRILFASSPVAPPGETPPTVRPVSFWLARFAEHGFAPAIGYDAGYLGAHAMLLERGPSSASERAAFAEIVRLRVALAEPYHGEATPAPPPAQRIPAAPPPARPTRRPRRLRAPRIPGLRSLGTLIRVARRPRTAYRLWCDARLIARSPQFDAAWYRARYAQAAATRLPAALHYHMRGWREGLDPGPSFSTVGYLAANPDVALAGINPLLHFIVDSTHVRVRGGGGVVEGPPVSPETLLARRWPAQAALPLFPEPLDERRLTILTDSVSAGSVFGGVGTALILGALLARRTGAKLRVATRTEPPDPGGFAAVLDAYGIDWKANVEFAFSGVGADRRPLAWGPQDWMLTTSWWTTRAALGSVAPGRLLYLLQEDERLFYPAGDDQLSCAEMLADPRVRTIVNTGMLLEHLQADGLAPNGLAFEPAFPARLYFREPRAPGAKKTFLFYARPNNARNLFYRGLAALNAALTQGVLRASEWEFHLVGKDQPNLQLPGNPAVIRHANMLWSDYASLVRTVDIGLSLIYTPHPSYPPLDIAASGGVAVTNRYGRKRDLARYSANILCVEPSVEDLVDALREAARLVADTPRREANAAASGIVRDWPRALAGVLDELARN
jgi:hypothetical protein